MRRALAATIGGVVCLLIVSGTFLALTAKTGFSGPGVLKRFPMDDLDRLAAKVNRQPDGSAGPPPCRGAPAPKAHVDRVRSRVIVDVQGPMQEPLTFEEAQMVEGVGLFACAVE